MWNEWELEELNEEAEDHEEADEKDDADYIRKFVIPGVDPFSAIQSS
jgi:hypothetical protein